MRGSYDCDNDFRVVCYVVVPLGRRATQQCLNSVQEHSPAHILMLSGNLTTHRNSFTGYCLHNNEVPLLRVRSTRADTDMFMLQTE